MPRSFARVVALVVRGSNGSESRVGCGEGNDGEVGDEVEADVVVMVVAFDLRLACLSFCRLLLPEGCCSFCSVVGSFCCSYSDDSPKRERALGISEELLLKKPGYSSAWSCVSVKSG